VIYRGDSFIGYIGLITAMRPGTMYAMTMRLYIMFLVTLTRPFRQNTVVIKYDVYVFRVFARSSATLGNLITSTCQGLQYHKE
jgi:hypothetical protein